MHAVLKRFGAVIGRAAKVAAWWVVATPAVAQIPANGQLSILFGGNGFGGRAVADVMYHANRNRPPDQVIAGITGQWVIRDPNGGIPLGSIELVENPYGACALLDGATTLRLEISNGATPLESRILCRIRYGGPWPDSGPGIRLIAQTPFVTINPSGLPTTGPALQVLNAGRTDASVPAGSVSPVIEYTVAPDADQRIDPQPEIVFPSPPAEGEFATYRFHIIQRTTGSGTFGVTTFSVCWIDSGGLIQLFAGGSHLFSEGLAGEPPRPVDLRCLGTDAETRATLICQEGRLVQGLTRWWDMRCPAAGSGEAGNQPGEPPLFRDGFESTP